jgi:hypothetical protein
MRVMSLEEERFSYSQGLERTASRGAPEFHLVYVWASCEELVPLLVGDPHVSLHVRKYPPWIPS